MGVSVGRLLFLVGIALAIVMPIRLWVLESIYIASPSMEPKLPVGGHVFLDKVTLRWRSPERGEIIVFISPVGDEHEFVKRVIAVGGDRVQIKEKKVFVNGEELFEPYAQHTRRDERLTGDNIGLLTVPQDALFVLGDNRDESKDSSAWTDADGQAVYFLPLKNVRGLVRGFY